MENKKQTIITILISTICSVIISVCIIWSMSGNTGALSIQDFNCSKINYTTETLYSDTVYYNGKAIINCKDKKGTYLVIYSERLVSGGTYKNIGKTRYDTCIVHNGKGEITTVDAR